MNKEMTDAAYQKAVEESMKNLERLETEIASAPNTKLSVKDSAKAMGLSFRELIKVAKIIGMVRSPEAVTQRLRDVQHMQLKQQEAIQGVTPQMKMAEGKIVEKIG